MGVSKTDGRMLATGSRTSSVVQTNVFDQSSRAADAQVSRIIAANGGGRGTFELPRRARAAAPAAAAASPSSPAASVATIAVGPVLTPPEITLK